MTYVGANGLNHALNWAVTDLWNCDLCADYSVVDSIGGSIASSTMTWDSLLSFSEATTNSVSLKSETSYYPLEYTLALKNCDD